MSDSLLTAGFDSYNPMVDYSKQLPLDFLFQGTDTLPSHPDLGEFESEIDSTLEGYEGTEHLHLLQQNDYSYIRPGLTSCGPLSAFTDSAYESSSNRSESAYNPPSPNAGSTYSYAGSTYSSAYELEAMALDFQGVCVDDYAAQPGINDSVDPTSFGPLPPTPPRSPPAAMSAAKAFSRTSYSDYAPARRSSITSELYPQITFNAGAMGGHSTVSPINISAQLPSAQQPMMQARSLVDAQKVDPRKKYKCSHCPRAFARAYNLKTHKATHDPNRLKPHVCPHRTCGRSFSRKHDLGRHLISIHRDDAVPSGNQASPAKKQIGVERGIRSWCDSCGKSSVGRSTPCDCHDVK
ncbi:hypothetical protein NP233_g622 [Leucocoprinus birnbaumii]|uniref:C2H2-type domain-containing protein n=1 Tax=Leucocoprinus birnbaumii TaxID=56174 RepID=A0AAD5YYI8_9AGAR|nr:hypothetical protein NP233_g622 [Leucocoprinus birnbaumii]